MEALSNKLYGSCVPLHPLAFRHFKCHSDTSHTGSPAPAVSSSRALPSVDTFTYIGCTGRLPGGAIPRKGRKRRSLACAAGDTTSPSALWGAFFELTMRSKACHNEALLRYAGYQPYPFEVDDYYK